MCVVCVCGVCVVCVCVCVVWCASFRPFDPNLYEDEGDEDDVLDEEGRARLKLKVCFYGYQCSNDPCCEQVENTIRWRDTIDENGNVLHESNARIVRWSDGRLVSLTL